MSDTNYTGQSNGQLSDAIGAAAEDDSVYADFDTSDVDDSGDYTEPDAEPVVGTPFEDDPYEGFGTHYDDIDPYDDGVRGGEGSGP